MPGNPDGAECPHDCLNNWMFEDASYCSGDIKSGRMTNIAPDATHLIPVEYADPKLKTVTHE